MSPTHHLPDTAEIAAALRGVGLRVTAQRVAVYAALARHPHSSADMLHAEIRDDVVGIALPTVHGVVSDLTNAGLVRRVNLPDHDRAIYELAAPADNHHHLQCIECGRVEDVACSLGHAPCLTPEHGHGMRILEATVTFRAICSDCERKRHE